MQTEQEVRITTYKGAQLLVQHTVAHLVTQILTHNKNNGLTTIVLAGKSGSGKTTLATTVAHRIHEREHYAVRYFRRDEIQEIDTILESLPKQQTVLVFDDISFSLEQLPRNKILALAQQLTYARHTLGSNTILILCVHYSKTLTPFFRDADFRILTSLSSEERQHYVKIFGSQFRFKLRSYENKYRSMTVRGSFEYEIDPHIGRTITYLTNEPFRLALCSVVGAVHFLLYQKEACSFCSEDHKDTLQVLSTQEFVDQTRQKYGTKKANTVMKWFLFLRGIDSLDKDSQACWNLLIKTAHNSNIDFDKVNEILKKDAKEGHMLRFRRGTETIQTMQNFNEFWNRLNE